VDKERLLCGVDVLHSSVFIYWRWKSHVCYNWKWNGCNLYWRQDHLRDCWWIFMKFGIAHDTVTFCWWSPKVGILHSLCIFWSQSAEPKFVNVNISPDGVAPRRMVSMSASVNLPLHYKVQKVSSGAGSSVWSQKKGRKTVAVQQQSQNYWRYPGSIGIIV